MVPDARSRPQRAPARTLTGLKAGLKTMEGRGEAMGCRQSTCTNVEKFCIPVLIQ